MSSSTSKLGDLIIPRTSTRQLEEVYGKPEGVPSIVIVGGVDDSQTAQMLFQAFGLSAIVRGSTNTPTREWTRPLFSSDEWADVLDPGKHRGRIALVGHASVQEIQGGGS